jgi:hypothetical protein
MTEHLDLSARRVDARDMLGRAASEGDYDLLIETETILYDGESRIGFYAPSAVETTNLRRSLQSAAMNKFSRMQKVGAFVSRSIAFGYKPRSGLRQNGCGPNNFATRYPETHHLLSSVGQKVQGIYARLLPQEIVKHEEEATRVRPEYRIGGTVFTSGIINRTSPLPYHLDTGNVRGVRSALLGLRKNVIGGYLVLPEYRVALRIGDGSLSVFDGQSVIHGVTPMRKTSEDGERYSIVFYTIEKMWKCATSAEELEWARNVATRTNQRKGGRLED